MRDVSTGQTFLSATQTLLVRLAGGHFSIAGWMYRTGTPAGTAGVCSVTGNPGGANAGDGWWLAMTTGNLLEAGIDSTGPNTKVRVSSSSPALNGHTHFLITHTQTGNNSTDFLFYFNGVQEAGTNSSTLNGSPGVVARGLTVGDTGNALTAWVGPLSIWGRALQPAEALALAGGAHPLRFPEGLLAHYAMDKGDHEPNLINQFAFLTAQNSSGLAGNSKVAPPMEAPPQSLLVRDGRMFQRERVTRRFAPAAAASLYQPWDLPHAPIHQALMAM